MKLIEALSIMSKSSPFAVSTDRTSKSDLQTYKDYIYIETDIEKDFKQKLTSAKPHEIIFLCGSSGDGKSEILTRYNQQFKATRDFHLDATHSFNPNQTAIQALDERFTEFKASDKPLVVGINIGMLGNYAEEGHEDHLQIRKAIKLFLAGKRSDISAEFIFLDFEDYPKFVFSDEANTSDFAAKLITRLTEQNMDNPFYALHQNQVQTSGHDQLTANFSLLGMASVQAAIIDVLLKARLVKDQFLTARALLDFIFQLLAGKGYLFDNLFAGGDNELLARIKSFDPSNAHTKLIDQFVLQFGLNIEDNEFESFKASIGEYGVFGLDKPSSYLRLFYLLKNAEFESNYHHQFTEEFNDQLVEKYASVWLAHRHFDGSGKQRIELSKFYKEILISSIHRYCNRNAPALDKDVFFVSEYNSFQTAVELNVKPNFHAIQRHSTDKLGAFEAYLQVSEKALLPIPVSINLMELMIKINQGYRPNKHDKNAVILLDEVIEQIVDVANEKDTVFILKGDNRYKITNEDNEYFEVSGI